MPLQSAGILVVDKTLVNGQTKDKSKVLKLPYRPNGGSVIEASHNIHFINNIKTTNYSMQKLQNNKLMRRTQRVGVGGGGGGGIGNPIGGPSHTLGLTKLSASQQNLLQNFDHKNQQMNQQQTSQPQIIHQHHYTAHGQQRNVSQGRQIGAQQQQVLVSEEYIEHSRGSGQAAGVISVSANELLSPTQIIKFVSDGNGGNMLIDTTGTTGSGGLVHHNQNSKVHVISNVTLVPSKQQGAGGGSSLGQHQTSTINFVNAKNLPYLTAKNANPTSAVQKIVNIPLRTNNSVKSGNAGQMQHHVSMGPGGGNQIIQKMNVPRNVQVMTRVQQLTTGPVTHQQTQHHMTAAPSQNNSIQTNQMMMQQKYVQNIVTQQSTVGKTTTKKHNAANPPMKVLQKTVTTNATAGGVKTVLHQQQIVGNSLGQTQQQTVKQLKSQKVIRYVNNSQVNSPGNSITVQQSSHQMLSPGGYTINNNKTSNVTLQHQQNTTETTKMIVGPALKNSQMHTTKYINYVTQTTPGNKSNNQIITQHQNMSGSASTGAIKYVNAQGAVVHSPHHQPIQQTKQQRARNNSVMHHQQQPQVHQQIVVTAPAQQQQHQQYQPTHIQYIDGRNSVSPAASESIYIHQNQRQTTATSQPTNSEIMILNGSQITEEMSAKILQNISQKAIYNNSRQFQQPAQYKNSQQQNVMLTSVVSSPEHTIYSPINVHNTKHYRSQLITSKTQLAERRMQEASAATTIIVPSKSSGLDVKRIEGHHIGRQDDDSIDEEIPPVILPSQSQVLWAIIHDHMSYVKVSPLSSVNTINPRTSSVGGSNVIHSTATNQQTAIGGCAASVEGQFTVAPVPPALVQPLIGYQFVPEGVNRSGGTHHKSQPQQLPQPIQQHSQDDDASSVISNGSRHAHAEHDLGEETETAPECNDDDSFTRCICELMHDDGYMICCDKCSAWQHIDCMGIDSQNIPDVYLCEMCQPRPVDKARAKALQVIKRKEQSLLLAQMNAAAGNGLLPDGQLNPLIPGVIYGPDALTLNPSGTQSKKGKMAKKTKEVVKKPKKERAHNIKKRETKRVTKRKMKAGGSLNSSTETATSDKQSSNLRQWIDNYEFAMTNHYSPELRARLHAITKQQIVLQGIIATENKMLKNCTGMESKCTTIPHAGGKIIISNLDVEPNNPIVELRGKYMLTTQYKTQNPSANMNLAPQQPNCVQQNMKSSKNPGPFIFFYQLFQDLLNPGPEICVDTRTYGNEGRFVRRSCRPNAEIQHSFEKGTVHLYIVSLTNIMASTEITIRHEPHDLAALENKSFTFPVTPTSTICACGLTKDCLFGSVNLVKQQKKTVNGFIGDQKATAGAKKNSQKVSRGRSTSSSGESNTALLSPNNNYNMAIYNSVTSVSNLMHDSGVYTSSSSPSVSLPSPTNIPNVTPLQDPPVHPMQAPLVPHQVAVLVPLAEQLPQLEQQAETVSFLNQVRLIPNMPLPEQPKIQTQQLEFQPPADVPQPINKVITLMPPVMQEVPPLQEASASIAVLQEPDPKEEQEQNDEPQAEEGEPIAEEPEPEPVSVSVPVAVASAVPNDLEPEPEPKEIAEEAVSTPTVQIQEPTPPVQQALPKPAVKASGRRTGKQRTSVSEESTATPSSSQIGEKRESRKLTREERKMEAIVRAFEKMEKNQQRKQELKQARITAVSTSSTTKRSESTSPSPKRVKNSSVSETGNVESTTETATNIKKLGPGVTRKKKRKGSKSYQTVNNNQRKRRKSRINSNDSDALTSEESTPLLSPPPIGRPNCLPLGLVSPPHPLAHRQNSLSMSMTDSECSSLHHGSMLDMTSQQENVIDFDNIDGTSTNMRGTTVLQHTHIQQPQFHSAEICSGQPAPLVSSTCLLIEAAVGPLENFEPNSHSSGEFRLPMKTKTKKSIMNDWLNQSTDYQQAMHQTSLHDEQQFQLQQLVVHHQQPVPMQHPTLQHERLETIVRCSPTPCEYSGPAIISPSFMTVVTGVQDEPENLSMVAKKVEEFIHQSDGSYMLSNEDMRYESNSDSPQNMTIPSPSSTNSTAGTSSVKKRWLRQAISEECSDEVNNSNCGQQNSAQNGFMTPLKKRRVFTSCDEENKSSASEETKLYKSEPEQTMGAEAEELLKIEKIVVEEQNRMEIKLENNIEGEDDVDIMRSPSPSEKIVAEDLNLVKIEPEDTNKDVKIDVEREDFSVENSVKIETDVDVKSKLRIEPTTVGEAEVEISRENKIIKQDNNRTEQDVIMVDNPIEKAQLNAETSTKSTNHQKETTDENYEAINDEIADIQKRLHSFHTENIMILQSRNKITKRDLKSEVTNEKAESSANTPVITKKPKNRAKSQKEPKIKAGKVKSTKKKHADKELLKKVVKDAAKPKKQPLKKKQQKKSEKVAEASPAVDVVTLSITEPAPAKIAFPIMDDKKLHAALTIPNFNQNIMGTAPVSTYVTSSETFEINSTLPSAQPPQLAPATVQMEPTQLCSIAPHQTLLNAQMSQPPALHLPYYNTVYGKLLDKSIVATPVTPNSNLLLADYLDTKAKSYSSLGGYVSHTALFGLSLKNVSNDALLPNSIAAPTDVTKVTSPATITGSSKILTRTASHDPRLNPSLTVPEPTPAPKRKLSINEYRKRKQQSTEISCIETTKMSDSKTPLKGYEESKFCSLPNGEVQENNNSSDSDKGSDPTKVTFSPAPTLLEQQQETLSERLKSLKSKTPSSTGALPFLSSEALLLTTYATVPVSQTSTSNAVTTMTNSVAVHKNDVTQQGTQQDTTTTSTSSPESSASSPTVLTAVSTPPDRI